MQKTISNLNAYIDLLRQMQSTQGSVDQGAAKTRALVSQLEKFSTLVTMESSVFQKQVRDTIDVLNSKVDCLEKMHGLPSTGK